MLKKIKITPLAGESLGVRSMCTYVETSDVKILLDAGVSLCPNRFGLLPHPEEFRAIKVIRKKIAEVARKVKIVTISHYHFDHHTPSFEDWFCNWTAARETARQIYGGKKVLVKNPKEKINYNQRRRGWFFQKTGGKYAEKLVVADGKTFIFGKDTILRFSKPVFHGPENTTLGWVIMSMIEYQDEKFLFAPDVQGPMSINTFKIIKREKPQVLMIGGPPFYLSKFKVGEQQLQAGLKHLEEIIETVPCIVLEHHILRDKDWRGKVKSVYNRALGTGHKILTAAEFLGKPNMFLEAERKKLFVEIPISKEFQKWMKRTSRNKIKPPI